MLWANITAWLDITLPNATTWTCMVLVLIVMLYVRFAKPLQWRHLDLLLLFLLAIPMLFLRDSQERRDDVLSVWCPPEQLSCIVMWNSAHLALPAQGAVPVFMAECNLDRWQRSNAAWIRDYGIEQQAIWRSYLWLMIFSALLLIRSVVDLFLEQRSECRTNVTTGAMIWLILVLIAVLSFKSFQPFDWKGAPRPLHDSLAVTNMTDLLALFPIEPEVSNKSEIPKKIVALVCHTLIVVHLILIGWWHFRQLSIGVAAGLLYLLMPYTAVLYLNLTQVVASLFIVMAITWYRWPSVAGLFLGLGTGFGFFPIILVPAWFGFYYRRGHWRFLSIFALTIAVFAGYWIWSQGLAQSWQMIWSLTEWQVWKFYDKPLADGLWNTVTLHWAYRIPLFIVFVALVITSVFWPHPKHLGQLVSWSAILILGVQFWYADAGGSYLLWYLPLVIFQTVRPRVSDLRPDTIVPERDRLHQLWQKLGIRRRQAPMETEQPPPTALAG